MIDPRTGEYAVIAPGHNFKSVTQKIAGIVLTSNTPLGWFFGLIVGAAAWRRGVVIGCTWLFLKGVGIWGVTIPGAWGFAIINFVWWIGIGHAGTLISAILLLFKQTWRNSINRFAEAMTIFAVVCAGMFPLIHVGRPWLAYWLFPYPEHDERVAAVPQPAGVGRLRGLDLRDHLDGVLVRRHDSRTSARCATAPRCRWRSTSTACCRWAGADRRGTGSGMSRLRCCWRGFRRRWCSRYTRSSASTSRWRRWRAGIRRSSRRTSSPAPIYSGFAMVITLAIPIRKFYHLEDLVTLRHLDNMAKVMLGDRLDRRLRLWHGGLHVLVLGQPLGVLHDVEPHVRADGLGVLDPDPDQPRDSADDAVVAQAAGECAVPVPAVVRRQYGHVV